MNKVNYQKKLDQIIEQEADRRPRLLLHSCCAPCSSYVLEYLFRYFRITVFYYNPNIDSAKEYKKRVEEQKRLIREMKLGEISVIDGRYDPQVFYQAVRGFEKEPEGGKRCYLCYQLRLREPAKLASAEKFDYFTTTLTISPLKNAQWLNKIGEKAGQEYGVAFLPSDFKKKGGYQRSIQLSKEYSLYRQNFCGCVFSKSESRERQKKNTQERQTEKQIEKNK